MADVLCLWTRGHTHTHICPVLLIPVQFADEWFLLAHFQNNRRTKGQTQETVGRLDTHEGWGRGLITQARLSAQISPP